MSRSLPHLTLTTSTSSLSPTSPIFQSSSSTHPSLLSHDPYTLRDSRQSGGSTQIPSLTGYEPKVIEPEEIEPRRIELDRNLGTDPHQTQDQNPVTEDIDEFGKSWCRDVLQFPFCRAIHRAIRSDRPDPAEIYRHRVWTI